MKKVIISTILALVMLLAIAIPAMAAPPVIETWGFADARNKLIRAEYDINTTTLKTSTFHFYNETSNIYAIPYVLYNGTEVWRYVLEPNSEYHFDYVVNFQRVPHTDPDDADSIRYPAGYQFGMWTGDDPNDYPPAP